MSDLTAQPLQEAIRSWLVQSEGKIRRGDLGGRPWGFASLDRLTGGLHGGDLTVLAGPTGVGKTSFLLSACVNVATPREPEDPADSVLDPPFPVLICSLEQNTPALGLRLLCGEARVSLARARQGLLTRADWERMAHGGAFLSGLPIWLETSSHLSLEQMRAQVAALLEREPTEPPRSPRGLVVLDSLQLLAGRPGAPNRDQQLAEVTRGLKALAKDAEVAVVAVSQINHRSDWRGDGSLGRSDLRTTGALGQDADNVLLLSAPAAEEEPVTELRLDVVKQRQGPPGSLWLGFDRESGRVEDRPGPPESTASP
jgi:replicative DNA helicase